VGIAAVSIDVFMVLAIAVGLLLLAAMVREHLPHRHAIPTADGSSRPRRIGGYGRMHVRVTNRRAA
jgi:hypothetical protein